MLLTAVALGAMLSSAQALASTGAPVSASPPAISGTAKDGNTLKAAKGSWTGLTPITAAYQWLRCDASGGECVKIATATTTSHKATHEDVGHALRVVVTVSNVEGSGTATSNATAPVAPKAPVKVKAPVISGPAQDGQVLSVGNGTWGGTPPFSYGYQWQKCVLKVCSNIAGATSSTYRVLSAELKQQLRALVTASNAAGSATSPSPMTKKVIPGPPMSTAPPVITGTPLDGQTLSAGTGTWGGTGPLSYTYQWQSCPLLTGECADIPGATSSSYTVQPLDVASNLKVIVRATNSLGAALAPSLPTGLVGALMPSNAVLPTISGLLQDGQLLSAVAGTWTGTAPISYAYQWQLCNASGEACKDIVEALESTLKLSPSVIGSTLRVVVTATNAAGSVSAASAATSLVGALLPVNTALPSISGLLQDGQLLSAVAGSWTGSPPISYGYQWQLCNASGEACKDIGEALEATLKLSPSLVGSTLRVVVTATNAAGSVSATSAASSIVGALLPSNTLLPSISGVLKDGQLLSAATGTWSGTAPISYGYQWQLCNASGEACKDISEAVGSTLQLSPGLVGSTVRVVVTATNAAGSVSKPSAASGLVAALLPSNSALPSVSGVVKDGQLLSATSGNWSGTAPISYGYQWQVCDGKGEGCKSISQAVESTLKLSPSLVGSTVRVVVTATNAAGSVPATSDASGLITALLPSATAPPTTSGTPQDGQLLSATTGTWSGTAPITYAYQWQLCNTSGEACKNISEAVASTVKLEPSLVGSTLRVVVTATNSAGSASAASASTSIVTAILPKNTALPTISGLLKLGSPLSATTGAWTGTPTIAYSYQWQSCSLLKTECKDVAKAIESTLKLEGLLNLTVRVIVTATNAAGSVPATSAITGVIGL
jgi:uncharacterized protein YukE